jgi:hypothetical protein
MNAGHVRGGLVGARTAGRSFISRALVEGIVGVGPHLSVTRWREICRWLGDGRLDVMV